MLVARSELSYYPVEELEVERKQRTPNKKIKQKKVKQKKKSNSFAKLLYLFIPMIILSVSLVVLVRYANITAVRVDITKLERQKVELEKVKMNLLADLEGIKSSEKIAQDAIFKLGMNYPTEGQVIYVSVENSINDYAEEPTVQNQFKKFFGKVLGLL